MASRLVCLSVLTLPQPLLHRVANDLLNMYIRLLLHTLQWLPITLRITPKLLSRAVRLCWDPGCDSSIILPLQLHCPPCWPPGMPSSFPLCTLPAILIPKSPIIGSFSSFKSQLQYQSPPQRGLQWPPSNSSKWSACSSTLFVLSSHWLLLSEFISFV